jgi:hypothetical protein
MAPQVVTHLGTRPTERGLTVDAKESSVFRPERVGEDTHPHACHEGLVFLTYLVEEDGEEVERIEAIPCRRCADSR